MRPIRLRFSGLHSYKTTQDVDFEELMAGGLFGIFGPTGSGKSTVLDAITLALYARVDRAGGTRQGILNDNKDTLFVDFTFELGDGTDTRRYQVERRYRRSGPHTINTTHARLIEWQGDLHTVLADKDGEVTSQIEQILGLQHEDFTRAVVLPQGKFAEFLAMKGSERRHMLERLFALEEYGHRLMRRISDRKDIVGHELAEITGGQRELGDASKEHIEALRAEMADAAARVDASRKLLDKVRREHAAAERMRSLQHELSQVQKQLVPLLEAENEISHLKDELRLAVAAEPIRRDLIAVNEAKQLLAEATKRLSQAQEDFDKAQVVADETDSAHKQARHNRQSEEPSLLTQRGHLEQAIKDEEHLLVVVQQKNKLQEQASALQSQTEALQQEAASIQQEITLCQDKLRKKQDEARRLTVEPRHRRAISRALAALDRLETAQNNVRRQRKLLVEAQAELDKAKASHNRSEQVARTEEERMAAIEADLLRLESSPPADDASMAKSIRDLEQLRSKLAQLESCETDVSRANEGLRHAQALHAETRKTLLEASAATAEAKKTCDTERIAFERAQEKARQSDLTKQAAALASALNKDMPCPVCGSTHHPAPATWTEADEGDFLAEAETKLHAADQRLAKAQQREALLTVQLQNAETAVKERSEVAFAADKRLSEIRTSLPSGWRELALADIRLQFADKERRLEGRHKAAETWNVQVKDLRRQLAEQRKKAEQAAADLSAASVSLAGITADYHNAQKSLQDGETLLDEASAALEKIAPDMNGEQVRSEALAIEKADEQSADLQTAIDQLDKEITTSQGRTDDIQSKLRQLETTLHSVNTDLSHLNRKEDELTQAIRQVTDGKRARDLLAEVAQRLTYLAAAEEQAAQRLEAANNEFNRCQQAVAVAKESLSHADESVETATSRLAQQLDQAGFASVEAASSALRSDETRQTMGQQIEEYTRALERLSERQDTLRSQIGDDRIDDNKWNVLEDRLEAAEAEREAANEAFGAIKKSLDDVIKRHEQWKALEKKRIAAQKTKNQLDQLTSLFRGNRFVEFVSEEYLTAVAIAASNHLGDLTQHRYALEIDSTNGFIIRDDRNGGVKRPVSSLSGGETFLTSLALALALSNQIQLHGTYPLEFFFLDEGFGTLDPDLLETVMTSLERLHSERVNIGIISHVPELRQRMSRRLIVQPATATQDGSQLRFERG